MAYNNLQDFINEIDGAGELMRVRAQVSANLEITEIVSRIIRSRRPSKAILFENVQGSRIPLLVNALGSEKRMLISLGSQSYEEISGRVEKLLRPTGPETFMDKIKKIPEHMASNIWPREVKSALCQEVVKTGEQVNLGELPLLKCWPSDGGRYITCGATVTMDPQTQVRNVGMYRFMVLDENSAAVHWHVQADAARHCAKYKELDRPMPVAIVLGDDPAVTYAASAPLPHDFDELVFASFLRKAPVDVVRCKTIDMLVPANAEIVIEGMVNPNDLVTEGPFGDSTGYYSPAARSPRFEVRAITHRKNPICPATITGAGPMEDYYIGQMTERIFLPIVRAVAPEVVDYHLPEYGAGHNFAFVSIKKQYALQARKVMHALWGLGQMMLGKFIVIVDEDIDVHNTSDVLFRMGANVDPRRDVVTVDGPVDARDHAAPYIGAGSKMGIDATAKIEGEGVVRPWPAAVKMDAQIQALVEMNWKNYGIS